MRDIYISIGTLFLFFFILLVPACGTPNTAKKDNASDESSNQNDDEDNDTNDSDDGRDEDEEMESDQSRSSRKTSNQLGVSPALCTPVGGTPQGGAFNPTSTSTLTSSLTSPVLSSAIISTRVTDGDNTRYLLDASDAEDFSENSWTRMQTANNLANSTSVATNADTKSFASTATSTSSGLSPQDFFPSIQNSSAANCANNPSAPSSSSQGVNATVVSTAPFNAFEELFGEAESKACNARGMFFDRNAKACLTDVTLAKTFECTKSGIGKRYESIQISGVELIFDKNLSEGFILDQCGERGSNPIVSFYNKNTLRVRLICAKGDPLCAK